MENIDYGKYNKTGLFLKIGENARRKMFIDFMNRFKPEASNTVLDVGVTPFNLPPANNFFEKLYPYTQNITMCSPEDASCLEKDFPSAKFALSASGKPLPFSDKQFDIVCCFAVIEHVGDYPQQSEFLEELIRVGKRLYLTTPNRWFPVELHTALPLVHWFPRNVHQHILRTIGMGLFAETKNLNLLSAAKLKEMLENMNTREGVFSYYKIYFHRLCGLASNIILYVDAQGQ